MRNTVFWQNTQETPGRKRWMVGIRAGARARTAGGQPAQGWDGMMRKHAKSWLLAAALLLVAAVLAGCTATPDNTGGIQGGQGNDVPFPTRRPDTVQQSPTPTATLGAVINLPSPSSLIIEPSPGGWGSIITSPQPFATPTVSGWGGILVQSSTPNPSMSPAPTPFLLKLGSSGAEVRSVQQRLKALRYNIGTVDGDFGQATEAAVKAFQARNGLAPDGVVGTQTLNKLNSSSALPPRPTATPTPRATATPRVNTNVFLQSGSSGADVRRMQERLISLGYLLGSPTGRFDNATTAAVYAFQQRNTSYADGIAGKLTLEKLYSSSARGTSTPQGIIGTSLQRGTMDSPAVRLVQSRLKELRFYAGGVDGDFGASTEAAVKAFQQANRLSPDGKVGSETFDRLFDRDANRGGTVTPRPGQTPVPTRIPNYVNVTPNPYGQYVTLEEGHSGALVRALQQALKNQGYFDLAVDGLFGFGTTDAVKAFQRAKGLTVDGKAGQATQRILFEGNYPSGS